MFCGIYDIRDESDRTGMRAVIEVKKRLDAEKILAALLKYSDLQVTFGVNMVAIAGGKPKQMSLKSAIRYYIRHQKNVVTARTQYELDKAKARAHILEGLMIAVDNLDEIIALIRASQTPKEAKAKADGALRAGRDPGAGDPRYAPAAPDGAGNRNPAAGICRVSEARSST